MISLEKIGTIFNSRKSYVLISPSGSKYETAYPTTIINSDGSTTDAGAYVDTDTGAVFVSSYETLRGFTFPHLDSVETKDAWWPPSGLDRGAVKDA